MSPGEVTAAEKKIEARLKPVVDAFNEAVESGRQQGDKTNTKEVQQVLTASGFAVAQRTQKARLDDEQNFETYNADKRGLKRPDPAKVAFEASRRVLLNEAEKLIYSDIMRRIMFGVTLRCTGTSKRLRITSDAVTTEKKKLAGVLRVCAL